MRLRYPPHKCFVKSIFVNSLLSKSRYLEDPDVRFTHGYKVISEDRNAGY